MLTENISQLTSDLMGIRSAIISKGQEVPRGTPTAQWGAKIEAIQAGEDLTSLVQAIGPPAAQGDTAEMLAGHVDDARGILATNLTAKGVTATQDETLQVLAGKVDNIVAMPVPVAGTLMHLVFNPAAEFPNGTGLGPSGSMFARATAQASGTVRISFNMKAGSPAIAYAQIYRNGIAVGVARQTSSSSFMTFSEDFSMAQGDVFHIGAYVSPYVTPYGYIQEMSYKFAILPVFIKAN